VVHSKQRVLFLCTGNFCRSQMAEGWLRSLYGECFESMSAGVDPTGEVNPRAVLAMNESGIDISRQRSQDIADSHCATVRDSAYKQENRCSRT
jgi:arsenate reductase